MGTFVHNYFKFETMVYEMLLKEKVYTQRTTEAGRRPITIAHLEPMASLG